MSYVDWMFNCVIINYERILPMHQTNKQKNCAIVNTRLLFSVRNYKRILIILQRKINKQQKFYMDIYVYFM